MDPGVGISQVFFLEGRHIEDACKLFCLEWLSKVFWCFASKLIMHV